MFGFTVDEVSGPPAEVWPDNWQAVMLYVAMSTQWRTGPGGAVGLDYNVLYHKLDRLKLSAERYDELEAEVAAMENEALSIMHSPKDNRG